MDFELNEEQKLIKEAASDFARQVLSPTVLERDETQTFPTEEIKQLAGLGFMGMMVDPAYGGSGLDTMSYVLAMEELSKIDAAASVIMSVNNSLVCWGLEKYGSSQQKKNTYPTFAMELKLGPFVSQSQKPDQMLPLKKLGPLKRAITMKLQELKIGLPMEVALVSIWL